MGSPPLVSVGHSLRTDDRLLTLETSGLDVATPFNFPSVSSLSMMSCADFMLISRLSATAGGGRPGLARRQILAARDHFGERRLLIGGANHARPALPVWRGCACCGIRSAWASAGQDSGATRYNDFKSVIVHSTAPRSARKRRARRAPSAAPRAPLRRWRLPCRTISQLRARWRRDFKSRGDQHHDQRRTRAFVKVDPVMSRRSCRGQARCWREEPGPFIRGC